MLSSDLNEQGGWTGGYLLQEHRGILRHPLPRCSCMDRRNFWRRINSVTLYPVLGLYGKKKQHCNYMSKSVYSKDYRDIIERLKTARIGAGLAQQEVANKLGKPQSYISKIESGERRLDVAEIKKFAVIYKKDISFFIK